MKGRKRARKLEGEQGRKRKNEGKKKKKNVQEEHRQRELGMAGRDGGIKKTRKKRHKGKWREKKGNRGGKEKKKSAGRSWARMGRYGRKI